MTDLTIIILDYNRNINTLVSELSKLNNVNILLINDGSTVDILNEKYAYKVIRYDSPINNGAGISRNIAINALKKLDSRYFMFIDSDQLPKNLDKILNEYMSKSFEVLSTATILELENNYRVYKASTDFLTSFSLCGYIISTDLIKDYDCTNYNLAFADEIPLKLHIYLNMTTNPLVTDYVSVSERVSKTGLTNRSYHNLKITYDTISYVTKLISKYISKNMDSTKKFSIIQALTQVAYLSMNAYARYNNKVIHTNEYKELNYEV